MDAPCKRFDTRNRFLVIGTGSTLGTIRPMTGIEAAPGANARVDVITNARPFRTFTPYSHT